MTDIYNKCLNAKYTHTAEGGDYAIEVDGTTLYLLFEWSDGKEDWMNNFDFPAKPYKRMDDFWFCHRGFLRVWKAMRDEIEQKVREIMQKSHITNIKCVGYSHGAPLSALATEDMAYLYDIPNECTVEGYGFGAPRVLWGYVPKRVRYRLRNFTTIRNIPDIVTHVPPALLGYRHAGRLVKVGKLFNYNPIDAHRSENYITELDNMVEKNK